MDRDDQLEMRKRIEKASRRKILRRQIELLAEYSRTSGTDRIPESSQSLVMVHQELTKTEWICFMRFLIAFFALIYSVKRFPIKGIKLIRR